MTGQDQPCGLARWGVIATFGLVVPLFAPLWAAASPPAGGWLALSAVGQGNYGTIKGRLVWGGDDVPPAAVLVEKGKAPKDPDICARDQPILSHEMEVDPKTKGIAHGFAYIVRPKGANPAAVKDLLAKNPKVEIDQKNCDFVPHSAAIHQDQTLVMKSSDPVGHNVRLTGFSNAGLNQMIAPKGSLDVKLVAERLPLQVKCDIHTWMHAHVMVFDHPFFAVTGPDGSFVIKGVPAGTQNFVVWHGRYITKGMARGMPIDVPAGGVVDVGEIKFELR